MEVARNCVSAQRVPRGHLNCKFRWNQAEADGGNINTSTIQKDDFTVLFISSFANQYLACLVTLSTIVTCYVAEIPQWSLQAMSFVMKMTVDYWISAMKQ